MGPSSLGDRLRSAERAVARLTPAEAIAAVREGAVIVDIRSSSTRTRDGVIAGSLHVPLTVLPWRVEPSGRWRSPHLHEGGRVVLVCDHGCSSLLAAADLLELGVDATDIVGGLEGWTAAGLPVVAWVDPPVPVGGLLGMDPPVPVATTAAGDG